MEKDATGIATLLRTKFNQGSKNETVITIIQFVVFVLQIGVCCDNLKRSSLI